MFVLRLCFSLKIEKRKDSKMILVFPEIEKKRLSGVQNISASTRRKPLILESRETSYAGGPK